MSSDETLEDSSDEILYMLGIILFLVWLFFYYFFGWVARLWWCEEINVGEWLEKFTTSTAGWLGGWIGGRIIWNES